MVGANDAYSKKIIISNKKKHHVLLRPARKPSVWPIVAGKSSQVLEETEFRPLLRLLAGPKGPSLSAYAKAVLKSFFLEQKGTFLFLR